MGSLWWVSIWYFRLRKSKQFQKSSRMLQNSFRTLEYLKCHLCKSGYYSEQYPHQQSCRHNTIHPQYQNTVHDHCFRKARGQVTIHEQNPWTIPQQNHPVYCLLSMEKKFTQSKSNSPSVIPAISWRIQGFLHLYKESSGSVFSRFNLTHLTRSSFTLPQRSNCKNQFHLKPSQRVLCLCAWIFSLGWLKVSRIVYRSFLLRTWLCSC